MMKLNSIVLATVLFTVVTALGEEEPGFVPLFNGKDFDGWVMVGSKTTWRVEDGVMRSDGGKGGGWIRTAKQYGNFILRIEWMAPEHGNSGVLIRTGGGARGFEVQILAPWTPRRDDLHCTGSIYGHVAVSVRPDNTPNKWHSFEITCDDKRITVVADGQKCTEADMDKVPSMKKMALRGYIGMQASHAGKNQWVKFRNIRIKDLDRDPEYVIAGLQAKDPGRRGRAREAAVRLGAPIIPALCGLLSGKDPALSHLARGTLFAIAAHYSAPAGDIQSQRAAVIASLNAQLQSKIPARTRSYAARLLGIVGGGEDAVPQLAEALKDPDVHEAARTALQRIPGEEATRALLNAFKDAPAERRSGLLLAIGARRDASAVRELTDVAQKSSLPARLAAIRALGLIADAAAAPTLEAALDDKDIELRKAAAIALLSLAEAQAEKDRQLALKLYNHVLSAAQDGPQRSAALLGLSRLGAPKLIPRLFAALRDDGTRATAFHLLQNLKDEEVANAALDELKTATGWKRAMLLRLLAERRAPGIDEALIESAKGKDERPRLVALEILSDKAEPANEQLFLAAAEEGSAAIKGAALKGYLRIADARRQKGEAAASLQMYHRALDLAADDAAKRMALAGITALARPESLPKIDALLKSGFDKNEVARAYFAIGSTLESAGKKNEAIGIFTKIIALNPPVNVANAAGAKLRELGVTKDFARELGFITNWWIIGPFPNRGQSAYGKEFFPEKEINFDKEYDVAGKKLKWKPHRETRSTHGVVELTEVVARANNVACYAYAEVTSDKAQDALVKLGTDDGFVLWLNGKRLAGASSGRPLAIDQDVVKCRLAAGVNKLLLKVLQGGGRWCFCLRVTDPKGRPLSLTERLAE